MSKLDNFWIEYDKKNKKKETQLDMYKRNGSNENILRFIKLGGGPSLGSTSEQYAKFVFTDLKERCKGDTSHDHTIEIDGEIIKVEQKTSTLNKKGDFMWQHVAEKHSWEILLLMGIHFNEIRFYGMNKTKFKELVIEGKITNQGNKNKDSEQGMWFNFSNVKNDIVEIKNNEDFKKIMSNENKVEINKKTKEEIEKPLKEKKNKSTINKEK